MMDEGDKKEYELSFLLENEGALGVIDQKMSSLGFQTAEEGEFKKITLAYPISKKTEAFFGFRRFLADPGEIKNFSDDLRVKKEILRFFVIANPPQKISEEKRFRQPERQRSVKTKEETIQKPRTITNEELEKRLEEILK